jgi:hypothetical protein
MHEALLDQKIQRTIDRDRGGTRSRRCAVDDVIGAERLVARQQSLLNLPPHGGEALAALGA